MGGGRRCRWSWGGGAAESPPPHPEGCRCWGQCPGAAALCPAGCSISVSSVRADTCWLAFSIKQISLARYFCKTFKTERPLTAKSQPKGELLARHGRVREALPARSRQRGGQQRSAHGQQPLRATGMCSEQWHLQTSLRVSCNASATRLHLLCPVYVELCKLIPEIPGAAVRWLL